MFLPNRNKIFLKSACFRGMLNFAILEVSSMNYIIAVPYYSKCTIQVTGDKNYKTVEMSTVKVGSLGPLSHPNTTYQGGLGLRKPKYIVVRKFWLGYNFHMQGLVVLRVLKPYCFRYYLGYTFYDIFLHIYHLIYVFFLFVFLQTQVRFQLLKVKFEFLIWLHQG